MLPRWCIGTKLSISASFFFPFFYFILFFCKFLLLICTCPAPPVVTSPKKSRTMTGDDWHSESYCWCLNCARLLILGSSFFFLFSFSLFFLPTTSLFLSHIFSYFFFFLVTDWTKGIYPSTFPAARCLRKIHWTLDVKWKKTVINMVLPCLSRTWTKKKRRRPWENCLSMMCQLFQFVSSVKNRGGSEGKKCLWRNLNFKFEKKKKTSLVVKRVFFFPRFVFFFDCNNHKSFLEVLHFDS